MQRYRLTMNCVLLQCYIKLINLFRKFFTKCFLYIRQMGKVIQPDTRHKKLSPGKKSISLELLCRPLGLVILFAPNLQCLGLHGRIQASCPANFIARSQRQCCLKFWTSEGYVTNLWQKRAYHFDDAVERTTYCIVHVHVWTLKLNPVMYRLM